MSKSKFRIKSTKKHTWGTDEHTLLEWFATKEEAAERIYDLLYDYIDGETGLWCLDRGEFFDQHCKDKDNDDEFLATCEAYSDACHAMILKDLGGCSGDGEVGYEVVEDEDEDED